MTSHSSHSFAGFLVLLAGLSCTSGAPPEGPGPGAPGDLTRGLGLSCEGATVCSGSGEVYTSLYRAGASDLSRNDLLQTFVTSTAGAPTSVRLKLRLLRRAPAAGTAYLHAELHEVDAAEPAITAPPLAAGRVDLASLSGSGTDVDLALAGPGSLTTTATYALYVFVDPPGEGATALVGIGALDTTAYDGGAAFRRGRRRATVDEPWSDGPFMTAGTYDVAFALAIRASGAGASCPTGTHGVGGTCVDIDGCALSPCSAGVSCTDVPAPGTGFTCGPCPAAFDGDGVVCSKSGYLRLRTAPIHSCGIRLDGSLWCWGYNADGQSGDTAIDAYALTSPTRFGTGTSWREVAGGYGHSCALQLDGSLWCWGSNDYGQLGLGDRGSRAEPARVGEDAWSVIAAGSWMTCGVKADGTLWCWGYGEHGTLGNGLYEGSDVPVQVGTDADWARVSVGTDANCALKHGGSLWCWGNNDFGQTGQPPRSAADCAAITNPDLCGVSACGWSEATTACVSCGSITDEATCSTTSSCMYDSYAGCVAGGGSPYRTNVPGRVGTGTDWVDVDASDRIICARRADSTLWCQGFAMYGAYGDGTLNDVHDPTLHQVNGAGWRTYGVGSGFGCGTKADGTLWCWGYNADGELGRGNTEHSSVPVQVGTATDWTRVHVGDFFACGERTGGIACWGMNHYAQLGMGKAGVRYRPAKVDARRWTSVVSGSNTVCGLLEDGSLWCAGANGMGTLGLGDTQNRSVFAQVSPGTSWRQVDLGVSGLACGARTDGTGWCWGVNESSVVGNGTFAGGYSTVPVAIVGGASAWNAVFAGEGAAFGVDTAGALWSWGGGGSGRLGSGSTASRTAPGKIGAATGWTTLRMSTQTGVFALNAGRLFAWGSNAGGELGFGTSGGNVTTPTQVGSGTDWTAVGVGHARCGLRSNTPWCWGNNSLGALGSGSWATWTTPTALSAGNDWQSISVGGIVNCGIRAGGQLWCWGYNNQGGIGDGTNLPSYSPKRVGTDSDWLFVTVSKASQTTCAIKQDRSLWCWGDGTLGQFGDGSAFALSPVAVP